MLLLISSVLIVKRKIYEIAEIGIMKNLRVSSATLETDFFPPSPARKKKLCFAGYATQVAGV